MSLKEISVEPHHSFYFLFVFSDSLGIAPTKAMSDLPLNLEVPIFVSETRTAVIDDLHYVCKHIVTAEVIIETNRARPFMNHIDDKVPRPQRGRMASLG